MSVFCLVRTVSGCSWGIVVTLPLRMEISYRAKPELWWKQLASSGSQQELMICRWALCLELCLHCPAPPTGVPGGGDFSPVHLEQSVSRQEGFRGPDSMDRVRTGAALSLVRLSERSRRGRRGFLLLTCRPVSPTQFQDPDFAGLSGGRVVRIAVHPDYQGVTCPPTSQTHGAFSAAAALLAAW